MTHYPHLLDLHNKAYSVIWHQLPNKNISSHFVVSYKTLRGKTQRAHNTANTFMFNTHLHRTLFAVFCTKSLYSNMWGVVSNFTCTILRSALTSRHLTVHEAKIFSAHKPLFLLLFTSLSNTTIPGGNNPFFEISFQLTMSIIVFIKCVYRSST